MTRKTAIRKMKAAAKTKRKDKRQTAKVAVPPGASRAGKAGKTAASKTILLPASVVAAHRAEGRRLFKLAGCPTREQVVAIYGQRGPLMTWSQRKAAGVSAAEFQKALAKAKT